MKTYTFKVVVEPDEDALGNPAWYAYCPALASIGGATSGRTPDEALRNINEVIHMIVQEFIEEGEPLPEGPAGSVEVAEISSEHPTFSVTISGLGSSLSSPIAKITHVVGDGQSWADTLHVNGLIIGDSSNPIAGALGSMWDNLTFDISSLVDPNGGPTTTLVDWSHANNTGSYDCLTWGAIVYSTMMASSTALDAIDPITTANGNLLLPAPNTAQIIASNNVRSGVAADGVAKLVIRFTTSVPGTVSFSVADQTGSSGGLSGLQGGPTGATVSTGTVQIEPTRYMALAVYTAPASFVRSTSQEADIALSLRQVSLSAHFKPATGPTTDTSMSITIVRPPVVLVHGLWSDYTAWDNFALPSDRTCADSGRFYACRANYPFYNSDRFAVGAAAVGSQIRNFIRIFRAAKSVAAIQADIIAHSMGGNLVRTLPLCGVAPFTNCSFTYRNDLNFNTGDVHRLVTIATPHVGSPLANILASNRKTGCCSAGFLGCHFTDFQTQWEKQSHKLLGGAIDDLNTNSAAIQALSSQYQRFPVHFVVGVGSTNDENLVNGSGGLVPLIRACNTTIIGTSIRTALNSEDSDLVVPVSSQHNNLAANHTYITVSSPRFGTVIHSSAIVQTGQSGFSPEELNSTGLPTFAAQIIRVLDIGPFLQ